MRFFLPRIQTFNSQVRTESLYGTNLAFPFPAD